MPSHSIARLRFLALCVALACRTAAYAVVTVLVLKVLQNGNYVDYRPSTLAAWLGLCVVPSLLLTPFIGPLAASRWNRCVLLGGTALMVAVLAWANMDAEVPWLSVLGVLSLETAFFTTAVMASISSLAAAAGIRPVTARLLSVFAAIAAVWFALLYLDPEQRRLISNELAALILAATSLLMILFVRSFNPEPVSLGRGLVRPFLTGVRDAVRHRRAFSAVVGLWLWFFVAAIVVVALVRIETLTARPPPGTLDLHGPEGRAHEAMWDFFAAIAVGILLSALNLQAYRHAGFVLYAAWVAIGCCLWLRFGDSFSGPVVGLGFALGLSLSPLLHFYHTWTTPKYHGIAAALLVAGWCMGALVLASILVSLGDDPVVARTPFLNILLATTIIAAILSFIAFFRPGMEVFLEVILWPVYRIRAFGPGALQLPARGPHLVIANHSAWLDPLFMAKICAMPITPMMTSKFYDLPVISWLMRNVIGTIRVPEAAYRSEAPELKEAVAGLDQGKCIVLFPEGFLRRKEEQPLRRFGRGVWQILVDRPETPVFACWIEGNWGSYLSFRNGPPTKNKRIDFWRHIRIGVIGPIQIDKAMLGDHMAVRTFLMRQVAAAREPLGLPPLDLPAAGEGDRE